MNLSLGLIMYSLKITSKVIATERRVGDNFFWCNSTFPHLTDHHNLNKSELEKVTGELACPIKNIYS